MKGRRFIVWFQVEGMDNFYGWPYYTTMPESEFSGEEAIESFYALARQDFSTGHEVEVLSVDCDGRTVWTR